MIIGDINTANKFYIYNSFDSIEWVPDLEIAKEYVKNPNCKEWFGKDIYATNENLVIDKYGKVMLVSKVSDTEDIQVPTIEMFNSQAFEYINYNLSMFSKKFGYSSIEEMISWKDSKIKEFSNNAKKALLYRDMVYIYYNNFIKEIKTNEKEFESIYKRYLDEFPKYNTEHVLSNK